jgi:hypothetical protein
MSSRDAEGAPTLLAIPQELRDMILTELLFLVTPVHVLPPPLSSGRTKPVVHSSTTLHPAILRTCKELHKQGIKLLYSSNRFCVTDPNNNDPWGQMYASDWLGTLSDKNIPNLTSITMDITSTLTHSSYGRIEIWRRLEMEFAERHTKPIVGTFIALSSVAKRSDAYEGSRSGCDGLERVDGL